MANTITSKTYNAPSPIINAIKSFLPVVCGVPESVLSGISDRYILELYADLGGNAIGFGPGAHEMTIHAYLQDKIVMDANCTWEPILSGELADLLKTADSALQLIANRSAISTVSTQRKWTGSSPISVNFKLKFEAVNDVYSEVMLPCQLLQSLTLPRGGFMNTLGLIPPGPNPFTLAPQNGQSLAPGARGEQISINIGNFIGFRSIIVKNVKVTYENRMSKAGPIGAEVDLGIETFRMLTREELQQAYKEKMQVSGKTSNAIGQLD